MLSMLNKEQLAAVRQTEGPVLILAGAGSGKTRVITTRIAYLIRQKDVPAESILAVTFTNKAAKEMKERVQAQVGKNAAEDMVISTFHSLGVRILRKHIERLGFKRNFSIYSAGDQLSLIRELVKKSSNPTLDVGTIQSILSNAKNQTLPPEKYLGHRKDPYYLTAAEVYPQYQKKLKRYCAIDFDDILLLTVHLFKKFPEVLQEYQELFRYCMVDEYQDTNGVQFQIMQLLCDKHRNLCVVGDDDQSIYGWRGAQPGNMSDFEKHFPGTKMIKLEQNYRSTGNILKAANGLIKNNSQRKDKILRTEGGDGAPIDLVLCKDENEEARVVAERILSERARNKKLKLSDFAVLFRSNTQSRVFEEEFRYQSINYVLIGGQQFFDRKEVKDVLAYLKAIANPMDEVSLLRVLNFPSRGVGDTSAERLIGHSLYSKKPLWTVLSNPSQVEGINSKAEAGIMEFTAILSKYRTLFSPGNKLSDTCKTLLRELKIEDEIYRLSIDDPKKARQRIENVEEVVNAIASYEEREASPTLEGFLEKITLLDNNDSSRNSKEKKLEQDAVVLMSLHSSKGLEFPFVFLVGMEEDLLPHKKSIEESCDDSEERRLAYVGITRAERNLVLLHADRRKKYGKMQPRFPSRFLDEIPEATLNKYSPIEKPELSEEENDKMADDFFSNIQAMLGGEG